MKSPTVFEMVRQVIEDSQQKLAQDSSSVVTKTAAARKTASSKRSSGSVDYGELLKVAEACDFLADHIHEVADIRSPQEKLAEYASIHEVLMKKAFDVGNQAPAEPSLSGYQGTGDKGGHQTEEAPGESQPSMSPPLDSGGLNPGGPGSAMLAMPTNTSGGSILEGGDSGEAQSKLQPPRATAPTEAPNPQDAANAMETNTDMMMAVQPENLLKQSAARTIRALQKVKVAGVKVKLAKKAIASGVPENMAMAMINKLAEDALYPAQINAGTEPSLQSDPGTPPQLMQGSEAGVNTPRETAPTTGEAQGRHLLASNEAAINATRREAHTDNARAALRELLSEEALSSGGDHVLNDALDSTPSAGVKISAARELIRKFASQSPKAANKVRSLAKLAQDPMMMGQEGAMPASAMSAPSDEAIEAARSGVTPEELEHAHSILQIQEIQGMQGGEEGGMEPGEEAGDVGAQGIPEQDEKEGGIDEMSQGQNPNQFAGSTTQM
jgi:hypothetical protein